MLNGIAYANVDALNIDLSDGNDHFTVASTPLGSTLSSTAATRPR